MTKRSVSPQKPHANKKAAREVGLRGGATPDEEWSARIREKILDECHPLQFDAVTDPAQRYSWLFGRGGTKTTSFMFRGTLKITDALVPRAKVLYFASTRQRAMDLMWFPLKTALHNLGIIEKNGDVTFNETALRCTVTKTGATYQLSGLQDIADCDKWRGSTFDEVQCDECGAIKPELLEYLVYQVIGPRVRCLGLGGTPGLHRRKIFYEVTRPGSDLHRPYKDRGKPEHQDFKGYSSHHGTLKQIIEHPGSKKYPVLEDLYRLQCDEIERNKWSTDNPIRRRELDAVWAADGTLRVFGTFEPHRDEKMWNIWDPYEGGEIIEGVAGLRIALARLRKMFPDFTDWRHVIAMDQGSKMIKDEVSGRSEQQEDRKDPFACSVITFSPHDPNRGKWQTMTFERPGYAYGKPIAELLYGAEEVDAFIRTSKFPTVYGGVFGALGGWPDGMIIDTNNTMLADLSNVYGIRADKADQNKNVKKGSVELTNGEFHEGRLFLIKGGHAAKQCEDLQWKEMGDGSVVEDPAQANHSSDTVVYGNVKISTMFSSGLVAQDSKPVSKDYSDPMGLGSPGAVIAGDSEDDLLAPATWDEDDEEW